jgi:hypothetical protein
MERTQIFDLMGGGGGRRVRIRIPPSPPFHDIDARSPRLPQGLRNLLIRSFSSVARIF